MTSPVEEKWIFASGRFMKFRMISSTKKDEVKSTIQEAPEADLPVTPEERAYFVSELDRDVRGVGERSVYKTLQEKQTILWFHQQTTIAGLMKTDEGGYAFGTVSAEGIDDTLITFGLLAGVDLCRTIATRSKSGMLFHAIVVLPLMFCLARDALENKEKSLTMALNGQMFGKLRF